MDELYIVAHDVGTQGNKAVLTRPDGTVVGTLFAGYDVRYPQPGWAEQDPADWWQAVTWCTQELLRVCKVEPEQVLCLTFSTQMLGVVPMSGNEGPLRPAIIWMDARAEAQAQQIMRKLLGPKVFSLIAGTTASGKDVVPKLLWLKQNEPEVFKRTAKFLDVNGYLIYRCTGQMVMDWSAASVIGLFDLKRKRWLATVAHCFGLPIEKLPTLLSSTDIVGGLKPEAAKVLGLLAGTPVVCGAGDVLTAAVGSGAIDDGEGHIYLGTSGWVGVITGKSSIGKHGIATIQSAQADKCLLIAETEAVGACWQWLAETMFHQEQRRAVDDAFQAINEAIEKVEPGAKQLLFTPWLYGERSPVADVFVRAAFVNLCPYHTREYLARAVSEGLAYNLRWIIEIMYDDFNYDLNTFRICGGGAQSDAWLQIIADVTGKCLERVAPVREVGAVGATLVASVALGLYPDLQTLKTAIKVDRVFQPQRARVQVYDRLFAIYKRLYFALKPIYRSMNLKHLAAS